jgi:hypothetical protein
MEWTGILDSFVSLSRTTTTRNKTKTIIIIIKRRQQQQQKFKRRRKWVKGLTYTTLKYKSH